MNYEPIKSRIVLISLEALGAVLRSTCLLKAIKRKYHDSHITWITYPASKALLQNNPLIDRIICVDGNTSAVINRLEFDILFAVDKSLEAGALAESIIAKEKYGFGLDRNGVIRPLNHLANYQYDIGLDDNLKFFTNQKPETQQITETMGLEWVRDPYVLELTFSEKKEIEERRIKALNGSLGIIGYNTGCSELYPYKKFTVNKSIELIHMWRKVFPALKIALLGGKEDTLRQESIKEEFLKDPFVINTPTTEGLRSGLLWMATSDVVFTGCSLGLHMAIALKKPVVCWFGVSCSQEIDLYDNGIKLQSKVSCSPCWKKSCEMEPKCFDQVSMDEIADATRLLFPLTAKT
ncbi:MAG: glycosyltransferase family 9 protein [Oligoflexales bacterium]|nr:glycosyltransferase family 9 protein [Oligoflexales bacterium]